MAGDGQRTFGAGEGDIGEPLALEVGQVPEQVEVVIVVLGARCLAVEGEGGEGEGDIVAQRPRDGARTRRPLRPAATPGERTVRHERDEDVAELQALGLVHGEQLHGIGRASAVELQIGTEPLGVAESAEEGAERDATVEVEEVRRDVDECGECRLLLRGDLGDGRGRPRPPARSPA